MANPVMSQIDKEFQRTPAGYPAMPGYRVGGNPSAPGRDAYMQGPAHTNQLREDYEQPRVLAESNLSGTNSEVMTVDDVLTRTGLCLALLIVAGAITWNLVSVNPAAAYIMSAVGALAALGMVLVATFKKQPSPGLTIGYAICEGVALGAISKAMESAYPGIVVQAVLGTVMVFLACLILFKSGLVKVTSKFKRITTVALFGILGYMVVNLVFSFVTHSAQGLNGMTFAGIPLGLIIGVVAVVIGAMSLIWDFDVVQKGVNQGVPKAMAWSCTLGIMVTVVWIYIEILRILSYLRER